MEAIDSTSLQKPGGMNPECSICLEEICNGCSVTLECNHVFHSGCLNMWVDYSTKGSLIDCPLCRATYRVDTQQGQETFENTRYLPTSSVDVSDERVVRESVESTVESTVSLITLIKFYRKRQIIMVITGMDIIVGLIRMALVTDSHSILIDSAFQVMVSSYGFFGAVYMRSGYLLIYFTMCVMSTILRFLSLVTYVQGNVDVVHGLVSSEHTLLIVAIMSLSMIVQGWITYITYRLRHDILEFREAFVHRFYVRVHP